MKLKKKLHQELADRISTKYNESLNFQKTYFDNFNEYYQIYRGVRNSAKQNYKGRANLFVPAIFTSIESTVPLLVGSKPNIEAIPVEPGDNENALAIGKLLSYQWEQMNMKVKVKSWVKQALIYGTGILKLTWSFKGEFGNVIQDKPEAELVDLFDFFFDTKGTNAEDAEWFIHRTYRNLEDLKDNDNYDIPKELQVEVTADEYKTQRDAIMGLSRQEASDNKKVELWEYWGKYDLNGDGLDEDCLIVIANRKYIIRAIENPYDHKKKPFIILKDTDIPFEFLGMGEVEPLKSLQYELNDVRNQRMDNVTLILNRMWLVDKGADVDEEDLVSQAGGVIHTGNMNGIKDLTTPDVTQSAYNEENIIKQDIKDTSGVTDVAKGSTTNSGSLRSAQAINMLMEAANGRFKYKLDNLEDSLKEFGRQLIALNQQFVTEPMVIRITGEMGTAWKQLNPNEIQGKFDIDVAAGSTQPMSKSIRRAEARELLATVAPFAMNGINLTFFIKYLLQTYDLGNTNEAFAQQPPAGMGLAQGLSGEAREMAGGPQGSALGGDVGNRPNNELRGLGTPELPN